MSKYSGLLNWKWPLATLNHEWSITFRLKEIVLSDLHLGLTLAFFQATLTWINLVSEILRHVRPPYSRKCSWEVLFKTYVSFMDSQAYLCFYDDDSCIPENKTIFYWICCLKFQYDQIISSTSFIDFCQPLWTVCFSWDGVSFFVNHD